jgi:hypothetical protein
LKKRKSNNALTYALGIPLLMAALFFVVPKPMQNLDYLQGKQVHYVGESTIASDQFVETVSEEGYYFFKDFDKAVSYENLGGSLVWVKYDTYAQDKFPYLDRATFSLRDTPIIYALHNFNIAKFVGVILFLAVLLFVLLLFWRFSGTITGKGKIVKLLDAVLWGAFRLWNSFGKGGIGGAVIVGTPKIEVGGLNGIVAVRAWGIWGSSLRSLFRSTVWEGKSMVADKLPERDNVSGVYAYRLGSNTIGGLVGRFVFGIVEMTGRYEYHGDGTIRAERCEIRLIVCHEAFYNRGRRISAKYGVPVCFVKEPIKAYHDWLFGENGKACMEHNYRILGQPSVFDEVKEILGG